MECRYCQAVNSDDDHRCGRCGRRLRMTPVYRAASSAAPVLQYETREAAQAREVPARVAVEPVPAPAARKPITYQPSLFGSRELPRVVPFETIAPGALPPVRKAAPSRPRPRHRRVIPGQQNLEFAPTAGSLRYNRPAEGVIYCDAPVALPAHRAMAAALDASLILIGLAIFGLIFRLAGGEVTLSSRSLPLLIGVAGTIAFFYQLLWCLANGDTAGMRWCRLAMVNFDGQRPARNQRMLRMASGALSLCAAGLGLLWALVDEETLAWHDHISKTFLTPN